MLSSAPPGNKGLYLVWPTVQEIRDSLEGWNAGRSVPGPQKNIEKPHLRQYWCRWGLMRIRLSLHAQPKSCESPHVTVVSFENCPQSLLCVILVVQQQHFGVQLADDAGVMHGR